MGIAQELFGRLTPSTGEANSGSGVRTALIDGRGRGPARCHGLTTALSAAAAAGFIVWITITSGPVAALPWLVGFSVTELFRHVSRRLLARRATGEIVAMRRVVATLSAVLSGIAWGAASATFLIGAEGDLSMPVLSLLTVAMILAILGADDRLELAAGFLVPGLLIPCGVLWVSQNVIGQGVAATLLGTLALGLLLSWKIAQLGRERRQAVRERALLQAESAAATYRSTRDHELLDYVMDGANASIVILDPDLQLRVWNSRFARECQILGLRLYRGLPYERLIHSFNGGDDCKEDARDAVGRYVDRLRSHCDEKPIRDEYIHPDGRMFDFRGVRTEDGCWVLSFTDITEKRKAAAEAVIHLSSHDNLTGLPNRARLRRELARALVKAREEGQMLGVFVVNLNDFKSINDTLGHRVGDRLLVSMARTLSETVGPGAVVSRSAADEFIIVTPAPTIEELHRTGRRILDAVKTPRRIEDRTLRVAASAGMAVFPGDGEDPEALLRAADVALHRAQRIGRDTLVRYEDRMLVEAEARARLEHDILHSLDNDHFILHYQPQIDLATNQLAGVEALMRWHHPERGWVEPAKAVAAAELSKLIIPLSERLLEDACRQAVRWSSEGLRPFRVAFNLSPLHLQEGGVGKFVRKILKETGLPADRLELEITESAMASDSAKGLATLARLDKLGVNLAIDDFGTGYSSMSYLRRLPINSIKIDRSFIAELDVDKNAAAIVEAMISLAHTLGLKVTAEGIETRDQLNRLRKLGCDYGQGYLFARPMPADELSAWVRRGAWLNASPSRSSDGRHQRTGS
ncbi:MAG: phosphodiesterase [Alphaproteobacteria bacterium]|nr:MAG: phosphodiesterase [Alphaproteobacteria bacterium]